MTDRTTARLIGVLFIVASMAAIIGGMLVLPVEEADTFADIAADEAGIVSGVLIELLMVLAGWLIVKGFDTRVLVVPETERATGLSLYGS